MGLEYEDAYIFTANSRYLLFSTRTSLLIRSRLTPVYLAASLTAKSRRPMEDTFWRCPLSRT